VGLRPITKIARHLRRNSTDVEQRLWWALRELPTADRFRRQYPIGPHVVDFACPGRKLAIELDGGQHAERREADALRTAELAGRSYRVIRFWNRDVIENLPGVLETIQQELGAGS
jgi:very-short-patch-repair endonuclease